MARQLHRNRAMRTQDRDAGWSPPHCPNPKCKFHNDLDEQWPWRRRGFYRPHHAGRPVQRFDCRACGVYFSRQTFRSSYWLKRPDLLAEVFRRSIACMCVRQIARDLECSPETVARMQARLGRHCMLFHMALWGGRPPEGPVVVDGFESFEFSQYRPFHHNLAVEANTDFWIYHTDSELRRKGRMTATQRLRRIELETTNGRADPKAVRKGVYELLAVALAGAEGVVVLSDEHKSYPPAIRDLGQSVRHEVTNSKRARTSRNPLFPVNLLDLLIRHSQSNHKRETIAFSKRRQASAEKLSMLMVWRNYMKWRREKRPGQTPAMAKGLLGKQLRVEELLSERIFPGKVPLPPRWQAYYARSIETREIQRNRGHAPVYAT